MPSPDVPTATFLLAAAAALVVAFGGCGSSADPVLSGELCVPAGNDCPAKTSISRNNPGSNVLDIVIRNDGPDARAVFTVRATGTDAPDDAGIADTSDDRIDVAADTSDAGDTGPGGLPGDVFPTTYTLRSGESVSDRFPATEVFTNSELELELACRPLDGDACSLEADYVLLTEPLECRSDDDCRRARICNTRIGKCVECTDDDDCDRDQTCHEPNGRCLPRQSSGCAAAPGDAPAGHAPLLVILAGLLVASAARRQRDWNRRDLPGVVVTAGLAVLLAAPGTASAASPMSTLSVGSGPRLVTGELGDDLHPGLGVELRETLRSKWVGGSAWIEAGYFLTRQAPPPLTRETTIFGFGLGLRGYIPIEPVEILYGANYRTIGFAPNTLIRSHGTDSNFHAVGPTLGVAYQYDQLEIRLDGSFSPIFGLPGSILSINLSVGIANRSR